MPIDAHTTCVFVARAVALAGLGAFLAWDNIAVGQFGVAPPAVSAVVIGMVVGDVPLGIWSALTFQLLWAGRLPVGAYVPPNAAVTGVAAVGLGFSALHPSVPLATRAVLAGALAVGAGVLAGRGDIAVKKANVASLHLAERGLDAGKEGALAQGVMLGALRFFVKDFVILIGVFGVGWPIITGVVKALPAGAGEAFRLAFVAAPAVGVGSALSNLRTKRDAVSFALGTALAGSAAGLYWLAGR